eukprot:CAMPEP_0115015500 /NCGR_PEP_ID=MMETSP0216-20121206/26813_1 /TAXON_ID=223996 /ORGANISM="Protocruzia adherens, Strain Boccale" /LENGTH=209 /DNA_ID=CAMNT_0002385647 /DNA_START=84 /DNA_END=710 /DNA_ORIENTATION=-
MEKCSNLTEVNLQFMSELHSAKSVIVPGAGPGLGALQVRNQIAEVAKLYSGDISEEMVRMNKDLFSKNGLTFNCEGANTTIQVMDNQQLPLESESCDRYIANLSLMIVPEPEKQISEAYRVLQPGGRAVASVWGRKEHSTYFWLPMQVQEEIGIETSGDRSNFHLNDPEKLKALFEEAGFSQVRTWYETRRYPIFTGLDYVNSLSTPGW